jgi:GNAT superfamily N-acetyltransferase
MNSDVQTFWANNDGFTISSDKKYLDVETVFQFLNKESYWLKGVSKELVELMIQNSTLCYGVYEGNPTTGEAKQIGFARVISDLVRVAWLSDVFIIPEYRCRGLSKWLVKVIVEHPHLKGTRFMLGTDDAHSLYEKFGFHSIDKPENLMVRKLDMQIVLKGHGLTQ